MDGSFTNTNFLTCVNEHPRFREVFTRILRSDGALSLHVACFSVVQRKVFCVCVCVSCLQGGGPQEAGHEPGLGGGEMGRSQQFFLR